MVEALVRTPRTALANSPKVTKIGGEFGEGSVVGAWPPPSSSSTGKSGARSFQVQLQGTVIEGGGGGGVIPVREKR